MIAYVLGDSLYLNITNKCNNNCCFCIRNQNDGVGGYNLWLRGEPDVGDIIAEMGDPSRYREVVFCGFGEPLYRVDTVVEVCRHIKKYGVPVRINTNGTANLIHGRNVVPEFEGLVDTISISLNADNAEKYDRLCKSSFGNAAHQSIIEFAAECKKYIPNVILSVIDLPEIDVDKCRAIADRIGASLRVRTLYTDKNSGSE